MTFRFLTIVALAVLIAAPPVTARDARASSRLTADAHEMPAHNHDVVVTPFQSNGCSGFREARFFSCCFVHDLAFWAGGTGRDRNQADLALRRCILDNSNGYIANFGYFLVRLTIVSGAIVDDGWGRAWGNSRRKRFAPLTPEQQTGVNDEKRRLCQALMPNPATGRYRVDNTREIRPEQALQICGGRSS